MNSVLTKGFQGLTPFVLFAVIFGVILACGICKAEPPSNEVFKFADLSVTFDGIPSASLNEAKDTVRKSISDFEQITHKHVPCSRVLVRLVTPESMNEMVQFKEHVDLSGRKHISMQMLNMRGLSVWTKGCKLEGMTVGSAGEYVIKIVDQSGLNFNRVLAHEMTHVYVKQSFGEGSNQMLNEGLAEYIASLQYAFDVTGDLKNAEKSTVRQLQPYVIGYQFCKEHAREKQFADFFQKELDSNHSSYGSLKKAWSGDPETTPLAARFSIE